MPKISPMVAAETTARRPVKIAILALSAGAVKLGAHLAKTVPADFYPCKGELRQRFTALWHSYDALICIMASGIVVRHIAPLMQDKLRDPAILVLDERGRFVISLLSGHMGGANRLAQKVAALCGGQAVITTASDVLDLTALDLWCASLGLQAADKKSFTRAMGRLVDKGSLQLWSDLPLPPLPPDIRPAAGPDEADLLISHAVSVQARADAQIKPEPAILHPQALCLGIGCNRGTSKEDIAEAVQETLARHNLARRSVTRLASIDLKADEEGLLAFAAGAELPLDFFSKEALNQVEAVQYSEAVFRATGAKGVAEPAALLAAGQQARLLVPKEKYADVTVAVACMAWPYPASAQPDNEDTQDT
ncbi:MAG: cobalamin biosynthesis protein [bacterium]|nr:cobalamin biosynthesis protein [bacterium]